MKKNSILFALLLASTSLFAQSVSNFTANDCSSVSHDLYTELAAGKVVVIEWVMPCSACIGGATAGYNAAQSFATSHPGKVLNYIVDDDGATPCSSLNSWITANSMDLAKTSVFDNAGLSINQNNYGGYGMPHVIVIGPNQTKYLDLKNTAANNQTAISNAIGMALAPANVNDQTKEEIEINYSSSTHMLELIPGNKTLTSLSVEVFDLQGKKVSSKRFDVNAKTYSLLLENTVTGMYIIQAEMDGQFISKKVMIQ